MIARFHYDRSQLQAFLDEDPGFDSVKIQSHVESCTQCQSELETLAQADFDWDQATQLLSHPVRGERVENFNGSCGDPTALEISATNFLEPTDHPNSLGRFARYEILEILGRGGMGIVMRGYDTSLNRHSAVKVLAPELANNASARKRFSREAKSAAAVVHPHVVAIQTVDECQGVPYLVMPVVEGKSVDARVRDSGPLTVIETVRIAAQIAEGLAAAHDQGLVHRDIKPGNVLLENGVERVQITDFGLARTVDDASMTRSGVIAGTPQYMSPEQAHGDSIDHRSDLFSLGSLVYFMLTGRSPFRAETTMGVLNRIVNDDPRSLRSICADVPDWLEQIVTKLLAKSPADRFQSAAEVAELLQRWHAYLQQPHSLRCPPESTALPSGLSSYPSKPKASAGGSRIGRSLVATGCFAFFALAGTIIYLKTSTGTLRIENNAQSQIPIVIRQDGDVVRELTVSQEGTTTRLRAGEYSIEAKAEDQSIELSGSQVTIQAGDEWVARIELQASSTLDSEPEVHNPESRDPSVVRQAAVEDAKYGRREAALEKILWCWEHGVQSDPAWYGVRRSFLLSDWLDLADSYAPAIEKLKSIRAELRERVLSETQHRVSVDDFADLAAIDRVLREDHRSIEVYEQLDPRDQERVRFFLPNFSLSQHPQVRQVMPVTRPTLDSQPVQPPKISPFTRMEFDDERVIVTFDSKRYELLGIDRFSLEELVKRTQDLYDELWKKRLSEDLVEVLWQLGHFPGQTVDLRLRSLESGEEIAIKDARMTKENRFQLYRLNEPNQPHR